MTGEVVRARPRTPFEEVVRLLAAHQISGLPVVDHDDRVVGVVSQSDLTRWRAAGSRPTRAWDRIVRAVRRPVRADSGTAPAPTAAHLMTSPAVTVHPEQRVADAARVIERRQVGRLPVVDEEDRLVGIVSRRDLLRVFLRGDDQIRAQVIAAVSPHAPVRGTARVRVDVRDGVVTLAGRCGHGAEVSAAVRAAWRVEGVVGVVSRLTVVDDGQAPSP